MMLYRLKLRPRSAWRTPWQADTLAGLLCVVCARVHGPDFLGTRIVEPMLASQPPFVLSDACPGDLLPVPRLINLHKWSGDHYKKIKRARWVTRDVFDQLRRGEQRDLAGLLPSFHSHKDVFLTDVTRHTTISRLTDTTGEAESGLGLFSLEDIYLRTHGAPIAVNASLDGTEYLSLYFRAATTEDHGLLIELLKALTETGFGADVGTGRGQFAILGDSEPVPDLDSFPEDANGVICLSTFQPGPKDPTNGLWSAFPKFGKLGPDLGLSDVRKRTLIMLRPGACFRVSPPRPWLGRAVPMNQLLPEDRATDLQARGAYITHPAFGLAVPAVLSREAQS
jgi:CRISPR-associated protein Csm4